MISKYCCIPFLHPKKVDGQSSQRPSSKIPSLIAGSINDPLLAPSLTERKFTQTGGHEGTFKELPGGKLRKTTSVAEVDLYLTVDEAHDQAFLPLKEIIPTIHRSQCKRDKKKVVFDNVAKKGFADGVMLLDIKLGSCTYSSGVDRVRGNQNDWKRTIKRIKMAAVDLITHRSWKVIDGKGVLGRMKAAGESEKRLKDLFGSVEGVDKEKVIGRLKMIQKAMDQAPVAFYGQSLLLVIGKDLEGKPKVEIVLIDIGNHLREDETVKDPELLREYNRLRENNEEAIESLIGEVGRLLT